ncbi:hypothetical protein [Oceanobacillus neutriphilus]|uniref:hypothetical protein n=1 Tax=Oceanobacillus neutriphilus TaxID=531815 RepID=UPI001E46A141|nr:hypothetical protein [Oceanobacillus neutriphilus]
MAICFYTQLLITAMLTGGETFEVLSSLAFGFTLFIFMSYLFYVWGKDTLRMKVQHFGKQDVYM